MTDREALKKYIEALEEGRKQRGLGEGVLSPRDWRRIEQWYQAGIPLGWIFECLDEVMDQPTFNKKRCWALIEKRVIEGWTVFSSLHQR